jgi:hypothetical protein
MSHALPHFIHHSSEMSDAQELPSSQYYSDISDDEIILGSQMDPTQGDQDESEPEVRTMNNAAPLLA